MAIRRINADKPHLWKSDIAASVDQFNQWFMRFAPEAFRSTRVKTTGHVKDALLETSDLRNIDAATLKANPSVLSTLRMCTAPPLAVDRLIGLAGASKNLVGRMEKGKLPTRMNAADLDADLEKLCGIISGLLDRDIFPWLGDAKNPTEHERDRASTIVADRLCSAVAQDTIRGAWKMYQLFNLSVYLDLRGYREIVPVCRRYYSQNAPGTYIVFVSVPAALGQDAFLPIDVVVRPMERRFNLSRVFIQTEGRSSFAKPIAQNSRLFDMARGLRMTYGDDVPFAALLGGYFGADYLGTQAAEGIDWVWQHRLGDLQELGV